MNYTRNLAVVPSRLLSALLVSATVLSGCSSQPTSNEGNEAAAANSTGIFDKTVAKVPEACEGGGIATGDEVTVSKSIDLRETPDASGKRIVNEKATEIFKETQYHGVDQSTRLTELCRQKSWSKIRIVEPDWLNHVVGWVPVSALRQIQRDSSGTRKYVAEDFMWDRHTTPYKAKLVNAVNRIVKENSRCPSVETSSLAKSDSRSSPGKPMFYVTCQGSQPFNVWFGPEDAANQSKKFTAIANIGQGEALTQCERSAKMAANNPQTVDFSRFMSVAFVPYPNGNSRLVSSFTAKNAFGVEGKFRIECFFEGGTQTETNISETID
ncbi:hypothetical protein [Sphingobium yanoikuyae]|uniref:hypothetical protein n=1 Tax=Sphingobium yanoikuyae TaxID=13690 RepID=UPI0028AA6203|nr:hypothetical protein [Sphingobium yanoikuyae]